LGLGEHGYSAAVLEKIVTAGAELKSFQVAARMLEALAEVRISPQHVGRLTEQVGRELAEARDADVARYRRRELPPHSETAPEIAVVETDGGRWKQRATGRGPGVHEPAWKEDKVACLLRMTGPEHAADPHPQPLECFRDRVRVTELVGQMKGTGGGPAPPELPPQRDASRRAATDSAEPTWPPERLARSCVATTSDSETFGPMVAAEAQGRNFFAAPRRAFLGDGGTWNWTIQRTWFRGFVPIVDFMHVLTYLFVAAGAVTRGATEPWKLYLEWMTACWQGRVDAVLAALAEWQQRLGPIAAHEQPGADDPRAVVARTRVYLEHNRERMNYPRYRRLGLPVTSSAIESLIKEVNYRVKGSEKFWNDGGAEAILQVRAARLSDDGRLHRHLAHRPGNPYRYHRSRKSRAA
jgi:hypothetical protein